MNYEFEETELSRFPSIGLIVGFMTTVVNFIFYFFFDTDVSYAVTFLNIISISYASLVPPVVGSIIFLVLNKLKRGLLIYVIFVLALTFLVVYLSYNIHYFDEAHAERKFHQLLTLMIISIGILSTFAVPFLAKNEKLTFKII